MTRRSVRRARGRGYTLRVDEQGTGPSRYVLVHGYGATSWYMLAEELSKTARVLMPTLPGWRGSERPASPLTVEQLADVVADWVRSEDLLSCVLAGNSVGCQVVDRFRT